MEVKLNRESKKLTVFVKGRVDTNTSSILSKEVGDLDGVEELVLDLKDCDYISSAGLRVLIMFQNTMDDQGTFEIINVVKTVMDIFETTGLVDMFEIKAI